LTKRKFSGADYAYRPLADWNVNHFIAFLAAETKRKFGVDYVPGGRGPISSRWAMERGMLKQAQESLGNAVLRRFIERCIANYRPHGDYLFVTFTFMWSWMRDEVARAQADVARSQAKAAREAETVEVTDIDELI